MIRLCDSALRACKGDSLALMRTCGLVKAEMQDLLQRPNYIFSITDPRCYSDRWGLNREFVLPGSIFRTVPESVRFEFFPSTDDINYDYLDSDEFMLLCGETCECLYCRYCRDEAAEDSFESSESESSSEELHQHEAKNPKNATPRTLQTRNLPR